MLPSFCKLLLEHHDHPQALPLARSLRHSLSAELFLQAQIWQVPSSSSLGWVSVPFFWCWALCFRSYSCMTNIRKLSLRLDLCVLLSAGLFASALMWCILSSFPPKLLLVYDAYSEALALSPFLFYIKYDVHCEALTLCCRYQSQLSRYWFSFLFRSSVSWISSQTYVSESS